MVRYVGITCHQDGILLKTALERLNLDTVLMALNAAQSKNPLARGEAKMAPIPTFESDALPTAVRLKMGIIAMKTLGFGLLVGQKPGQGNPAELIRYNLSLPVSTVIIGTDSLEILEQNVNLAKVFNRLSKQEMNHLREKMHPSSAALSEFFTQHADGD